jgi:hypothetical protein
MKSYLCLTHLNSFSRFFFQNKDMQSSTYSHVYKNYNNNNNRKFVNKWTPDGGKNQIYNVVLNMG